MRTRIVGDGGDNYQFLGFQFLAGRLFKDGIFPFGWTTYWRYPVGIHFQSATDSTLISATGLVLYPLLRDPVVVYNSTILILLLSNVLLTYWALRTWFDESRSVIGAVTYGLSFYSLAKVGGHVNLLSTAGFVMLLASVYRLYCSRGAWADWIRLGLSFTFLAFASLQYPLIVLGSVPILLPFALWYLPKETREFARILLRKKGRMVAITIGVVCVFSLFHGHKLLDVWNRTLLLPGNQLAHVSPINWFVPNAYIPALVAAVPNGTRSWIESSVFLGYVEMVLLVIACIRGLSTAAGRFLLVSMVVTFILALGDPGVLSWLWPYPYLFSFTPFRGVIEPARLFVLVYLAVTLLILILLQEVRDRRLLMLVFVLLAAERFPRNFPLSATLADKTLIAAVQERPTNAVLDFPAYSSWWFGSRYDLYSVYYERPIVNGYVHWSGDYPQSRSIVDQFNEYRCNFQGEGTIRTFDHGRAASNRTRITEWLIAQGIRVVVVHKDLFPSERECGVAYQYVTSLFEDADRWEVLLDGPQKRVLWLKQ
jgi:hypothetical protein